jgi:outer membrane immunogenic protein
VPAIRAVRDKREILGDMTVKRIILSTIAISTLLAVAPLSIAGAADMPLKAPPCCEPAWSWTGFYIGGNVGGGWLTERSTRLDFPDANYPVGYTATKNASGILGGGQIGYDFQFNGVVLGVFGGADAASLTGTTPELGLLGTDLSTQSTKWNWIADAGGRAGLAWGTWLPYVKGGGAWMHYDYTSVETAVPAGTFVSAGTSSKTLNGWIVGGGWEHKIASNISAFAEYDYYGFSGNSVQTETAGPAVGSFHDSSHSGNISVVKAGLNFRFNWAPALAPAPCCATK